MRGRLPWLFSAVAAGLLGCGSPSVNPGPAERPVGGPGVAATELYGQAEDLEQVALSADRIVLARGVLIEDDGPAFGLFDPAAEPGRAVRKSAAGPTDTPYWEPISRTKWARKTLLIGPLGAQSAGVLFFAARTGDRPVPLVIQVNGAAVLFDPPGGGGPRWWQASIDPSLLRAGENEIVLRTDSEQPAWALLIAPKDHFARGSLTRRTPPGRSCRSTDAGANWQAGKLGRDGSASGEYGVRVVLDQHAVSGQWTGPVVDLAEQTDPGPIRRAVTFASVSGQVVQSLPPGSRVDWEIRTGSLARFTKDTWSEWARLEVNAAGQFVHAAPVGRFAQLRAGLFTEDPSVSPAIRSVRLAGGGAQVTAEPAGLLRVTDFVNQRVIGSSIDFVYETVPTSRLATLDSKFGLATAVRGARTQFEQVGRVLDWLAPAARKGLFLPGPAWYATEILATQTTDGEMPLACQVVLCEALLSKGITARIVGFATADSIRPAVEFWSNDYGQWVLADGLSGHYFIDAQTSRPLDGLQVRDRFVRAIAGGVVKSDRPLSLAGPTAEALGLRVVAPGGMLPANYRPATWPAGELLLIPRNNFATADRPLPLNMEHTQPGWTEWVAWAGPPGAAARPWLPRSVERRRDLYWTLNQAEMEIHHGKAPGELWVYLHTQTPSFDTFQVNVDETGWKPVPANFNWLLVSGPNTLKARVRNKAGGVGPASTISVEFFPPPARPGGSTAPAAASALADTSG